MKKVISKHKNLIYPIPVVLMGANVAGKPNYNLLGNCGILSLSNPAILYVSSYEDHYTNKGVQQNNTFSVNIPSVDMVKEADYCGIKSGNDVDKSKIFNSFYGVLETAPMIEVAPINMECKVVKTFKAGQMDVFVGEIIETYVSENCATNGKPNIERVNPLIYSLDLKYYQIGDLIANAYLIGKKHED